MEAILLIVVVVAFWATIGVIVRELVREPEVIDEPQNVSGPMTVGRISRHMAIPRKHPAMRTRHSRSLR